MSKTVDERVVSMQFDNKNFENNVRTTMSTLERLKQSLYFKGATKGFDDINAASKKVDMTHLGRGLETVQAKFSALQVVGVTALANITNSAVNAGKRITKALTIEPVTTGFSEYETKINSIQTIMSNTASKGTTMEDVTRVINELNTYADKTIYNFAEMTKNIGTFTAAGVGLEESAAAIQGIANLAAASGSTSQQASTAMYQLSQALAAGTVKLMDWNSVVNAGMGGEKFQEALKATAREHGIAVDSIIKKNGSFRESLSEGWISADILNETLNKFTVDGAKNYADSMVKAGKYTKEQADALVEEAQAMEDAATKVKTFTQLFDTMKESVQSGWAQTWELIIGNFEEAKDFLSGLSESFGKVIDGISNARNKILGEGLTSKWDQLNEKIEAAGQSSEKFQELVKEGAKKAGIPIDDLIKKHGSLAKVISKGKIPANIFTTALKKLIGAETDVTKSTKDLGDVVKRVINGEFGTGEERVKKLTEAGYDYATVQNKVNELLGSSVRHTSKLSEEQLKNADSLAKLSDKQLKSKGYTDEQIKALRELEKAADDSGGSIQDLIKDLEKPSGRMLLLNSVQNILKAISKILGTIKDAWKATFDPITGDHVYSFAEGLSKLTEALIISDEAAANFQRVMEGLFSAFKLATGVITKSLTTGLKLASAVLSLFGTNLLEVAAFLADYIVKFRKWVEEHTMFIGTVDKLAKIIKVFIEGIKRCAKAFMSLDVVSKSIERFKNLFTDLFDGLGKGFKDLGVDSFCSALEKAFDAIEKWIKGLNKSKNIGKDIISGIVKGLVSGVKNVANAVIKIATTIIDTICDVLGIHSPSVVMMSIGKFLIAGLILGIVGSKTGLFSAAKGMFVGLFKTIKANMGKIIDWLKNIDWPEIHMEHILGLGIITGLVFSVKKILDVMNMFGRGVEGFGDMCSGAGKLMSDFGDRINPKKNKFTEASNALLKMASAIAVLAGSVYLLAQLKPAQLWNAVGAIAALTVLLGGLTLAASKLKIKGGDFGKLATLLLGLSVSLLVMATAIKKLEFLNGSNVGPILLGVAGMVGGIIALLFAFGKLTKGILAKNIDKASIVIAKISVTMLLLTWAIKSVSKLEPGALTRGMATLALFGAFVTALIYTTKFAGPNVKGLASTLIAMTVTMGLFVGVIKLINGLEPGVIAKGILCMTLFGGLIAGLIAATRLAKGPIKGVGPTMIGISGAMMLMALTIKMVSGMKPDALKKGLTCVTIFGAVIVALVAAVSKVKSQVKGVAGTILAMSVAIGVLAALSVVMGMISLEGLAKGVTAISILSGMMALMVYSLKGAEKAKGTVVAMTVAIGLLVGAVVGLSFMDPAKLAASTAALSAIMLTFAMLLKSTAQLKTAKGTLKTMFSMLAIVAALGAIVAALSFINPERALGSAAALSVLMLSFSAAMVILGHTGRISTTVAPNMYSLLAVTTGLAAILVAMSALNTASAIPNAIALSVLLNAMATAMTILGHVGKVSASVVGTMALLGLVVAELAAIMGLMSYLNVEASIPNAIALSVLLNAMAAAMAILQFVGNVSPVAIGSMALLGLVVAELAVILGLMSHLNVEASIPTATALSVLLLSMSAALGILTLVGLGGPAALVGVGSLLAMVTALGGLMVAVGALATYFPALETFLDKGIGLLEKLAHGLGSIIGNFISGFATAALAELPKIGTLLSQFMTNAMPFITGIKMVDDSVKTGVGSLAAAIVLLTGADVVSNAMSFLSGGASFSKLGKELSDFIKNAKPFIDGVKGMGDGVAQGAKAIAETVLILTAADVLDGVTSWLTGGSSIADFGSQLGGLGTGLKTFTDKLGKFDEAKVTTVTCAANAVKSLASAAKELPNEGGLWGALCGENSLAAFSDSLPGLGTALTGFLTELGTFDKGKSKTIDSACEAVKSLASAAKELPNDGGLWGALCGENSLATFSGNLPGLGTALSGFLTELGTFDKVKVETIDCAGKAIKALASAASELPNDGGFWGALCGENSIATFSKNLPGLGTSLSTFATNLGTFDKAKIATIDGACSAMNSIAKLGSIDLAATASGLPNLGKKLGTFAENITAFVSKMSEVSTDTLTGAIDNVKKLISLAKSVADTNVDSLKTFGNSLKKVAKEGVDGFVKAFNGESAKTKVTNGATAMLKAVIEAAKAYKTKVGDAFESVAKSAASSMQKSGATKFKSAGQKLIESLIKGIKADKSDVEKAAKSMAKAGSSAIKTQKIYDAYSGAGKYCVEGFAAGIKSNTFKAEAKAKAMAKAALKAAEEALDENSPSKEFYKVGAFGGQGFINAFVDYQPKAFKAGSSIAQYATKGLSNAVAKMRNIIASDMDYNPTIRPVLDLSAVTAGAGAINGMFDMHPSVGIMSNIRSIGSMMNNNQNGNDDVVSAIKRLGTKLDNVSGDTYIVDGVTYDDGSNVVDAVQTLVRAAKIERRR